MRERSLQIIVLGIVFSNAALLCFSTHARSQDRISDSNVKLIFPDQFSFGRLRFLGESGPNMIARGSVIVPRAARLELTVSYEGSQHLSCLKRLPPSSLKKLVLRRLEITDAQLKNLEHLQGLEDIDLSDTDVSDAGASSLAKLKNIRTLNMRSTLMTGKCIKALQELPHLGTLNLGITGVTNQGLEFLQNCAQLSNLNLVRTSISDEGLICISKMPKLINLDVSLNNRISDYGVSNLTRARGLQRLSIANTSVTAGSINSLKKMHSLRQLIYSKNQFAESKAAKLRQMLPKCKIVEVLDERSRDSNKIDPSLFAPIH